MRHKCAFMFLYFSSISVRISKGPSAVIKIKYNLKVFITYRVEKSVRHAAIRDKPVDRTIWKGPKYLFTY